jgi:hypothetical protein
VRYKTSPFSSPSTPLSRSISNLPAAGRGSRVPSDGGLILVRELDERLGFGELIEQHLTDSRRGENTQFPFADLPAAGGPAAAICKVAGTFISESVCGLCWNEGPWSSKSPNSALTRSGAGDWLLRSAEVRSAPAAGK